MLTLGIAVRVASETGMPFDSVAWRTAGKVRSATGATGGALRGGPSATAGTGVLGSGAGGATLPSSPQPPRSAPSSVRSPGSTTSV